MNYGSGIGNRELLRTVLVVGTLMLAKDCPPAAAQEVIRSGVPLETAALILEQNYAVPVTYDDPHRFWLGEVTLAGKRPDGKQYLHVIEQKLEMPELPIGPGAALSADIVNSVIDRYHQQNPSNGRFRVERSALGFHIIPSEIRDAQGALVPTSTPLDAVISVPKAERTAFEHLTALFEAVQKAAGVPVLLVADYRFNSSYAANNYYVPDPVPPGARPYMVFEWGTGQTKARSALVDLLLGSRTTLTWRLKCGAYWNDQTCFFTPTALQVGPQRKVVGFDRCTNCQMIPLDK